MADKEIVASLNTISSNLADISNTLKRNNNEKVEEPVNYDEMIQELITEIDNEKFLFTVRDELHGYGNALFIAGIYLFLGLIVSYLPNVTLMEKITFLIAIGALLLTFISFVSQGLKNNVVDANFGKAIKKFKIEKKEEEKRLLLKALLKTKATNPKSKLGTVKKIHKDMFTKEMLLEKLYE